MPRNTLPSAAVLEDHVLDVEVDKIFELRDHPSECHIAKLVVLIATSNVHVYAGKPCLLQTFWMGLSIRLFPHCWRKWATMFVQA